jgi:hypothetical protein
VTLKKNTCATFKVQRWLRHSDFELFVIDPFHVQEQNVGVIKIVQQFSFTIRHPETMFEKFLPSQPTILKQMTPYALLYSMERPSMLIEY